MRDFYFAGIVFFMAALVTYTPTPVLPVMRGLAPAPVATPPLPSQEGTIHFAPSAALDYTKSYAVTTLAATPHFVIKDGVITGEIVVR